MLLIEKSETGFAGFFPELPTILVVGDTREELTNNAQEALDLYFEEIKSSGSPIPEPHVVAELLEARQ